MTRTKSLVDLAKEARGIEPTARLHLIYICGYAYSSSEYYASQATLASDTETSVSSVFRTIKWLVAQRILIPVAGKRRATKTYLINRAQLIRQADGSHTSKPATTTGRIDRQNLKNQKLNQRDDTEPVKQASKVWDKPPRRRRDPYDVSDFGPCAKRLKGMGYPFD